MKILFDIFRKDVVFFVIFIIGVFVQEVFMVFNCFFEYFDVFKVVDFIFEYLIVVLI